MDLVLILGVANRTFFSKIKKKRIMFTDNTTCQSKITSNNKEIEHVKNFEYFGSIIYNNEDCSNEVRMRQTVTIQRFNSLRA